MYEHSVRVKEVYLFRTHPVFVECNYPPQNRITIGNGGQNGIKVVSEVTSRVRVILLPFTKQRLTACRTVIATDLATEDNDSNHCPLRLPIRQHYRFENRTFPVANRGRRLERIEICSLPKSGVPDRVVKCKMRPKPVNSIRVASVA